MTGKTIRQTLREGAALFASIKAAVFTTFNFNPEFFENNVLPALFDIEDMREGRRRVQVNSRLLESEVCVLYDASTRPKGGGHYRYQRVGLFRPGGFFHPKLMILAGTLEEDERPWIYITAASANLTLSGWGKNQEVIGEAWVGSSRQRLFGPVREALEWLRKNGAGRASTPIPAIDRCLAVMDSIGGSLNIGASTNVSFYFSPVREEGFLAFLKAGPVAKWDDLLVLSPYWGEVAENVELAPARKVTLAPALLDDGNYGLGRGGLPAVDNVTLHKLARLENNRFWHAKAYVLSRGNRVRIGVGSANFTGAGLSGGKDRNVEAMLVYDVEDSDSSDFLPSFVPLSLDDPRIPEENANEGPEPAALEITVVYDWKSREYLIVFTPEQDPSAGDYRLILPVCNSLHLKGTNEVMRIQDRKGPVGGSTFRLSYVRKGADVAFDGLINEINVDFGDKPYFRSLSLLEILESWRMPTDAPLLPPDDEDPDDEVDAASATEGAEGGNESQCPAPTAQFDVLNLYEMYRSFYALRRRMEEAVENGDSQRLLGHLVTRSDSVYRVARQAGEDTKEHPVQRFLVLLECQEIMDHYQKYVPQLDEKFWDDLIGWVGSLRQVVLLMPKMSQTDLSFDETTLSWFETELKRAWSK